MTNPTKPPPDCLAHMSKPERARIAVALLDVLSPLLTDGDDALIIAIQVMYPGGLESILSDVRHRVRLYQERKQAQ